MNRQEAMEVVNFEVEAAELVCLESYYNASEKEQAGAFVRAVERLQQPLTLAEFLGWEEDVEYKCWTGKYKIVNGELLRYWSTTQEYEPADVFLSPSSILTMRKAEKAEYKKKYRVPLPGLITTDGMQQFLTEKDGHWFASRLNKDLKQEWAEEELCYISKFYRSHAIEVVDQ